VLRKEISWTRLKREHGNGVIGKESIECNFFVSRVLAVDEVSLERERWVFRSVQSRLQYQNASTSANNAVNYFDDRGSVAVRA